MTIELYDAVKIAKDQVLQLFAEQTLPHLMLEEVNFDETEQAWLITLGYDSHHEVRTISRGSKMVSSMFGDTSITTEEKIPRVYKVFKIDASDGHLISMKAAHV
ncbi:hypothetical protein H206_00306 [Candidatus Electrothrix aarhusensis]|jgi:hypothetical protein|uniref:Uncharacterized protein n=1 Tax=Candidatus Electrothrix aarhusensis TaxID=1859131 RepID=A0A3S3U963_9BACT|nr:hypothetical protein H206_00306 [Candidatus Electrothrix aarhusensis]